MSNRLHIGNLPSSITDQDLADKFGKFGVVNFAAVVKDGLSGESRGFGFVEMADLPAAESAIKWLNFSSYEGQVMTVSVFAEGSPTH